MSDVIGNASPLMMDRVTFLESVGAGASQTFPTIAIVWKGSQTAGTPVFVTLTEDLSLVSFCLPNTACVLSRSGVRWLDIANSTWSIDLGIIALSSPGIYERHCNVDFVSGDMIFLDSSGGLGTSDTLTLTFERRGS